MSKKVKVDELTIEGVTYVPKASISQKAETLEGLECVMIRTYSAGVFYGYLKSKRDANGAYAVELLKARRVWQWSGAATLRRGTGRRRRSNRAQRHRAGSVCLLSGNRGAGRGRSTCHRLRYRHAGYTSWPSLGLLPV